MKRALETLGRKLSDGRGLIALTVSLFLASGLFVLSVLPPYEGWDEYQHLAFLEYTLETGHLPILGESEVPRSLYSDLVRFPHSPLAVEQVKRIGARSYEDYWRNNEPPPVRPDARTLPLYQAQQAPLYYQLVAPIYRLLKSAGGLLAAVTGLRLLNLLFGAVAVGIAVGSITQLLRPGPHRCIVGLLIATQPLYLLNVARVSNDALAVMLGTIAVAVCLSHDTRRWWVSATLGGTMLGLAVIAKANLLGLAPFFVLLLVRSAWTKRVTWGRASATLLLCFALASAVSYRYFAFNIERFGLLTPLQEAVKNTARGRGVADMAEAVREIDWQHKFVERLFKQSLWRGGWSMLSLDWGVPGIRRLPLKIHGFIVLAALVGGIIGLFRRRISAMTGLFQSPYTAGHLAMMGLCMTAALAYHALQSQLALKSVGTNAWYGAVIFPWMLALGYAGLSHLPGRIPAGPLALLFLANQMGAQVVGVLIVMAPAYTGQSWGPLARERISMMHLKGMGAEMTLPALAAMLVLSVAGLWAWRCAARNATAVNTGSTG